MPLLAIDIGNTHIKLGLFDGLDLVRSYRLSSSRERTADEYSVFLKSLIDLEKINHAVIASVVPTVGSEVGKMIHQILGFDATFINPVKMDLMPLRVDYPQEIGVDRVVNCYAAKKEYGFPLIVIDFGTATTFDVISSDGAYEGGAIAVGVEIAAEALFEKTALLPHVRFKKPQTDIGKNTRSALYIGIYEGLLGQVEFIVKRFKQVLGDQTRVIATGGLAEEMVRECPAIELADADLSLKGLAMIYQDKIGNHKSS